MEVSGQIHVPATLPPLPGKNPQNRVDRRIGGPQSRSECCVKVKISLSQAMEAPRFAEIKAPTLLRQTANRWQQGCQPYLPAALYPQVSFFKIPGTRFCYRLSRPQGHSVA
jgi:hypothetical protein